MPKHRPLPPLERLNELLEIVEIPEDKFAVWSGLIWKVSRGTRRSGSVAGTPQRCKTNPDRIDWIVSVDRVKYVAARVIYFIANAEDPGDAQVDHADQNWLNNNAGNLRLDVDGGIQDVNRPMYRNNVSGVVGVCWDKKSKKWKVQVKEKHLGFFTCKIEAARMVNEKWIELGWDKLGRKLNDLEAVACDCGSCVSRRTAKRVSHDSDV